MKVDFGSFDLPSSQLSLSGFRRRMRALDLPERGLPELEILEDIAPTWRPPGAGWPWPPISWPPGLRWPKVLWPLWPSDWSSCGPRNINGRIKSLAIHPVTGDLTPVEIVKTGGKTPRNFALSPEGNWLLCGHQDTPMVTVFRVDAASGLSSGRCSTAESRRTRLRSMVRMVAIAPIAWDKVRPVTAVGG